MATSPEQRPALDQARVDALLGGERATPPAAPRVEIVPSAPSTNALVADRARAGEPEGLVLVTEHQTAGRGRMERSWDTPDKAALTLSVLWRPDLAPERWPLLPLVAGVATVAAVTGAVAGSGAEVALKWPNDLLVDGRKAAGILAERIETAEGPAAVIGIGINVLQTADELPADSATSLALVGAPVDRTSLLVALVDRLWEECREWLVGSDEALLATYAGHCVTAHEQPVEVHLPGDVVLRGVGVGIGPSGVLRVRTSEGEHEVAAGDVVHVRPAVPAPRPVRPTE